MKFFPKTLAVSMAALSLAGAARADIIEVSGDITADTRWTRDNVYLLSTIVYVLPPAKLTVEPGTIIRGANDAQTGGTNNPGTLAICRGAKIIANATVDDPIIFTSADDTIAPLGVTNRPTKVTGNTITPLNYSTSSVTGINNNAFSISQRTGGLVLLGRTPTAYDGNGATTRLNYDDAANTFAGGEAPALPTGAASPELVVGAGNEAGNGTGFAIIEGLSIAPATLGVAFDVDGNGTIPGSGGIAATTSFQRGVYGGVDEDDNSGVVRFLNLRYGGFPIAVGIEINGLTMGGVGRSTTIEFVEISNNADDNAEWFGGYVNCRYLAGMFGGDDGIDWDQGYSGTIQFSYQAMGGGEHFPRVGYGNSPADASTAGKDTSISNSERAFELDGPEPNGTGVLPRSKGWVFNVTVLGNRGGVGVGGIEDGLRVRRGSSGQVSHSLFEDINSGVIEQSDNVVTAGRENDTDLFNSLHFNTLGTAVGSLTGTTILTTGLAVAPASQLKLKGQLTKNGMDPTLIDEATPNAVARDFTQAIPSRPGLTDFLSPVRYTGGMRDNNWMFGWTWAHAVELFPTTNMTRPEIALSVPATNPVLSFNADTTVVNGGDAVLYVVERSLDGRSWAPFCSVQDNVAADVPNLQFADSDATAGLITVTDTTFTYTGTPVHYRVIAQ